MLYMYIIYVCNINVSLPITYPACTHVMHAAYIVPPRYVLQPCLSQNRCLNALRSLWGYKILQQGVPKKVLECPQKKRIGAKHHSTSPQHIIPHTITLYHYINQYLSNYIQRILNVYLMFSTFTTFHATKKQRKKIASNAQKSAFILQKNCRWWQQKTNCYYRLRHMRCIT